MTPQALILHLPARTAKRLAAKIRVDCNGCWLWTACVNSKRYGCVSVGGRTQLAHRIVCAAFSGPIPDGYEVDHLCRVIRCVNPDHLEAVTAAENRRRQYAHRQSLRTAA